MIPANSPSSWYTFRKALEDFAVFDRGRYCKALRNVKFRQIEGTVLTFRHIGLSNMASSVKVSKSVYPSTTVQNHHFSPQFTLNTHPQPSTPLPPHTTRQGHPPRGTPHAARGAGAGERSGGRRGGRTCRLRGDACIVMAPSTLT